MLRDWTHPVCIAFAVGVAGCTSPSSSSNPDGGPDAGSDAGIDAGVVLCPGFIDGGQRFDAGAGTFSPVVAWSYAANGSGEIYLKRWNGSAWEELADSGTGGGVSQTPTSSIGAAVAIGSHGNPSVAWI